MTREYQFQDVLSAKAATGAGNSVLVDDFRHINFSIGTAGMGASDTIIVKVQGSFTDDPPDFDAAKSASNLWDYIDCKDLEDMSDLDGDTGILFEDVDDVIQVAVNVDGMRWVTLNVTTISDTSNTSVTAKAKLFND